MAATKVPVNHPEVLFGVVPGGLGCFRVPGGGRLTSRELISGGFGGEARVWSTTTWSSVGELQGHTSSVNGIAVTSDGRTAVTVGSDRTLRLWDLPARRHLAVLGEAAKAGVCVDPLPDGARAVSGGLDARVRSGR